MSELAYLLISLWKDDIAEAWQEGALLNAESVLAYMAYGEQIRSRFRPWLCPTLTFPPTRGIIFDQLTVFQLVQDLQGQQLSLLLTEEDQIIAALELSFSPEVYPDYRQPLLRLSQFSQLAGKAGIWLARDPRSGKLDRKQTFRVHPEVLCVYAILCQESGLGLRYKELQKEEAVAALPKHFLHLTAAIKSEKSVFGYQLVLQ